ncbi:MAG: glycosyl hydrolase family 28-related protein [Rikenellaceae bacterium]
MANLRQEIAVGSTGAEFVTAFTTNAKNANIRVFNVEDYGAVHDNLTDDTVTIQAAIAACDTAGGGVIYFPVGIYVIGGALVGTSGGTTYNSQITIPYLTNNDETRKTFHLLGEVSPNMAQSSGIITGGVNHITPSTGVILKSTLTGNAANQSVICGGKYLGQLATMWGEGNANQIIIENIQVHPVVNGDSAITIGGINMRGCIDVTIRNVCCYPFNLNVALTGTPINNCIGIAMPLASCGNHNKIECSNVGGFETGYMIGEHTILYDTVAISCLYGYQFTANYQVILGVRIGSYWCKNDLYFTGSSRIKITELQTEWAQLGTWFDAAYTILDPSDYAHGEVCYSITEHAVGYNDLKFSKSGGANIQCFPIAFAAATSFTVTGVRDNPEAALKNLLTVLAAKGIIVDTTTET